MSKPTDLLSFEFRFQAGVVAAVAGSVERLNAAIENRVPGSEASLAELYSDDFYKVLTDLQRAAERLGEAATKLRTNTGRIKAAEVKA